MTGNDWLAADYMLTHMGIKFRPLDPKPEDIHPRDIAHSLSMLCRYNGHVDRFYSVAEHCILMSQVMPTRELALEALLHDGTEAYVGDMVRPLKHSPALEPYRDIEDRVMVAIAERFGLLVHAVDDGTGWNNTATYLLPPAVKDADKRILLTERTALLSHYEPSDRWKSEDMGALDVTIHAWSPDMAEVTYLERLAELGVEL